jgi:glutamine synthetase
MEDPAKLSWEERHRLGIREGLPKDLGEALTALAEDEILCGILGTEVVERYISVKRGEEELLTSMSEDVRRNWIIERY